jgi:hypothetical protein
VFTVAAATDRAGLLYLAVDVARTGAGRLEIARYPALVGAPASTPSALDGDATLAQATDPALGAVVRRALGNYLAGDAADLAADLAPAARVSEPAQHLSLQGVQDLRWDPPPHGSGPAAGGSLQALVRASDATGASYTLEYALDVELLARRWLVAAIGTDPDGSIS